MTIQVELLNKDQNRSVKVVYRDISVTDEKDQPASVTESLAGVIKPTESEAFWIHAGRQLLLIENEEQESDKKD